MRIDPKLWKKVGSIFGVSASGFTLFAGFSLYNGNEKFYDNVLMPLIHTFDPESSHKLAILASKYHIIPSKKYPEFESLKTKFLNFELNHPIGLAAGFDKDGEAVKQLLDVGFGFVEIGSVTPLPQPGNAKPRVFRLKENSAVINRYGFNSDGHEVVAERLKVLKDNRNFHGVIGVNLGKNKTSSDPVNDYVLGIKRFSTLADYIVVNISSPNTPGLRDWQKKEQLKTLLKEVVNARNSTAKSLPLFVKLSPDLSPEERSDIADIVSKSECRVDGLVISNTTLQRPDVEESIVANENGGLSGAPLNKLSTQLIHDMYYLTKGKVPIIGVGGVFSGNDAFEKIVAGASLIQLYTALIYHGPPRIQRIKKELDQCLRDHGFSSIEEAVGSAHKLK